MFTQFAIAYSALATATASVCSRLFGFVLLFLLALDLQRMICYFLFLLLPILLLLFVREDTKSKQNISLFLSIFFLSLKVSFLFVCNATSSCVHLANSIYPLFDCTSNSISFLPSKRVILLHTFLSVVSYFATKRWKMELDKFHYIYSWPFEWKWNGK